MASEITLTDIRDVLSVNLTYISKMRQQAQKAAVAFVQAKADFLDSCGVETWTRLLAASRVMLQEQEVLKTR